MVFHKPAASIIGTTDRSKSQQPPVSGPNPSEPAIEDVLGKIPRRALVAQRCWRGCYPNPSAACIRRSPMPRVGTSDVRIADRMGPGNDELKDLGVEFDRMISRLRTLIVAQRQLVKDVSHEMRAPDGPDSGGYRPCSSAARSGA